MESTQDATPQKLCKNCGKKLSKRGKFCPSCGQRDFDGRVRMRELLGKFFSSFTHLDNKFVKMSWELLVPARVTLQYFQGKIKRYPHPVQFFFIVMFFFLLLFSKKFDGAALNVFSGSMHIGGNMTYSAGDGKVTVTQENLMSALRRCMVAREYKTAYESLPETWRNTQTKLALDSIHRLVSAPWEASTAGLLNQMSDLEEAAPSNLDTVSLNFGFASAQLSTLDFVSLDADSIIRKYQFRHWTEQVIVKQSIKAMEDQQGLIHRYVGSFGWAVLVLIAIMALVLRLLYWKRGGYYVEHFIFLMHQQSGAFLFLTLAILIDEYLFKLQELWLLVLGWIGVSLLIAMRRYYKNSWWWTLPKWLLYCLIYLVVLTALFIGTLLVVFLIF